MKRLPLTRHEQEWLKVGDELYCLTDGKCARVRVSCPTFEKKEKLSHLTPVRVIKEVLGKFDTDYIEAVAAELYFSNPIKDN